MAFAVNVSRAFTTADDWDAAFADVEAIYADSEYGEQALDEVPGGDWVEDTCGFDPAD